MTNDRRRLWIVTPVFNDVESFLVLRDRVRAILPDQVDAGDTMRFVVVDDSAGRDPDIEQLCDLDDVRVIRPPFNLGHQRALVHGLRALTAELADGDDIVTMDADGEDRPEDLPRLLEALDADPQDPWRIVVARRTKRRESVMFKLFYGGFRLLFRTLTGRAVRSGNFAAFHGRYVNGMLQHPYFDLCYSSTLISLSRDLVYVPCERGSRYAGQSRMGAEKLLMHGVRMLMPFSDRIAIRSLAFFALTAVFAMALGVVVVVGQVSDGFVTPTWMLWLLAASAVASGLALVNFLVLFSGFVQSMALAMIRIDPDPRSSSGSA